MRSTALTIGRLSLTIGAFTPNALVLIERAKLAADDYKEEPFSLDRRSKAVKKYGSQVVAILRRYSEQYPEFLDDKFFGFSFYDEIKVHGHNSTKIGLTIRENASGLVDTLAVATFVQVLFQVFDMDDTAFVSPIRVVQFRGGEFVISEAVSVTRHKIVDKKIMDWLVEQTEKMDVRKGNPVRIAR